MMRSINWSKTERAVKEISLDAHLLSMSATPIPRTLNMALSQIKSFSELLTPPDSRKDVKTFVKEFNPQIIKEAILREKRRGGQSFYNNLNLPLQNIRRSKKKEG